MHSPTEENYLKTIYRLQLASGTVSTSAVAHELNTRPASVTDMMKKLHAKNLLHYTPYYGFSLSGEGKKVALNIVRRHRLWEFFLAAKLDFRWDEVHEIAEELEHVRHPKLIEKLDAFLGFPQFDPHGDPIPDSRGRMKTGHELPLAQLPPNQPAAVSRILNQSAEMLQVLQHQAIGLGTVLEVMQVFAFDQSLEIIVKQKKRTISAHLATNIMVHYEANRKR